MDKYKIEVPEGIRYISEWKGYDLSSYTFPHILNKVLTGCGYTEYCIGSKQNIILVSPRKFLLDNKEEQHPGEVYYFRNEFDIIADYEKDIGTVDKIAVNSSLLSLFSSKNKEEEEKRSKLRAERLQEMKDKLWNYVFKDCIFRNRSAKILVTYDSFRYVKDCLREHGIFDQFQVVVDEFQSIFIDARFKSSTEIELLYQLQDVQKLCFVSATPMLDEYLGRLDEFKNLPYYELDWETLQPGRTKKPKLEIKFTYRALNEELNRIVQKYKDGKFESRRYNEEGRLYEIESREAVFFLNSVKGICQAIRSNRLHVDECNILCAKTDDNEKKVRRAFNEVIRKEREEKIEAGLISRKEKVGLVNPNVEVIGKIPVKGEPHKMFTFCTRTVYLGADFYSTNARTFIFSDSNIDCLSVDISMDLEQILGRQRLDENPWKDMATLIIKTTKEKITRKEFNQKLEKKIEATNNLLNVYTRTDSNSERNTLADSYRKLAEAYHYIDNYVAVNSHAGSDLLPVFNNLMLVSEQRAFDIQQVDYADRFSVFNSLCDKEFEDINDYVKEFATKFNDTGNTSIKFKNLVEFSELDGVTENDLENLFQLIPAKYGDYYKTLGPERMKAFSYREVLLKQEFNKLKGNSEIYDKVSEEVYKMFEVGKCYLRIDIKSALKVLYSKMGYNKTAKASDLSEYFIIKAILTRGDRKPGYEIIAKK